MESGRKLRNLEGKGECRDKGLLEAKVKETQWKTCGIVEKNDGIGWKT
jgi:hypothetical protein